MYPRLRAFLSSGVVNVPLIALSSSVCVHSDWQQVLVHSGKRRISLSLFEKHEQLTCAQGEHETIAHSYRQNWKSESSGWNHSALDETIKRHAIALYSVWSGDWSGDCGAIHVCWWTDRELFILHHCGVEAKITCFNFQVKKFKILPDNIEIVKFLANIVGIQSKHFSPATN